MFLPCRNSITRGKKKIQKVMFIYKLKIALLLCLPPTRKSHQDQLPRKLKENQT